MKTKILMVSEPGSAGVKRHVLDLLFNLDRSRFKIHYIYSLDRADGTYKSDIHKLQSEKKVKCTKAPMVRGLNPLLDYKSMQVIKDIVVQYKPDIIHAHSSKAGFLIRVLNMFGFISDDIKIAFTPNVLSVCNSRYFYPIEKILGYYTDMLIASSQSEKKQVRNWNLVNKDSLTYIYLACKKERGYPQKKDFVDTPFTISACGRICKQKRALLFFQVARKMAIRRPAIRFKWIGDFGDSPDEEAKKIKNFIKKHKLNNIEITGWINDPDKEIINSDIFCMFSRYESFGYVTVDAMMMQVPVLAIPAMGTVDHILEGETGWLCDRDPRAITDKIIELKDKPEIRSRIAARAKKFAKQRYNLQRIIDEHEVLYNRMINEQVFQ